MGTTCFREEEEEFVSKEKSIFIRMFHILIVPIKQRHKQHINQNYNENISHDKIDVKKSCRRSYCLQKQK